ncbi:MAG: Ryanodine receptor Ryr [Acidobacteria bacterium]|nr:MAG: Ryanodine receptor Ryr [Acidobacteriota bacterium]
MMQEVNAETLERLAEAAHKIWMEGKLRDGWVYGPVTNKAQKIHSCLVVYEQLSESDKESDRDMVRGIPEILAAAGYKIVRAE